LPAGSVVCLSVTAPAPDNVQVLISNHCRDRRHNSAEWFYTRPRGGNCEPVPHPLDVLFDLTDSLTDAPVAADDVVFVFQFPNPHGGHELTMSRLHQSMLSVFTPIIGFDQSYPTTGLCHCLLPSLFYTAF